MAKNNNKKLCWAWKITRIALAVGVLLVAIASAYARLNQKADTNSTTLEKHEVKIDANREAVIELKTDVKYIRSGMEKQTAILEEIRAKVD